MSIEIINKNDLALKAQYAVEEFSQFLQAGVSSLSSYAQKRYQDFPFSQQLKAAFDNVSIEAYRTSLSTTEKVINVVEKEAHGVKTALANSSFDNFLKVGLVSVMIPLIITNAINMQSVSVPTLPVETKSVMVQFNNVFESKTEAFLNILRITEGKSNKFYHDNKGVATAYGWNPTRNSKEFNKEVAQAIGLPKKATKVIEEISANPSVKYVPKQLKNTVLSDKQVYKSAVFMMDFYERQFIKVLRRQALQKGYSPTKAEKFYYSMPYNQQAVMMHMAYKLGNAGLSKYNNFFGKLFTYMENPNERNFKRISHELEYTYVDRKGDTIRDTKAEDTHFVFFNNCAETIHNKEQIKENITSCNELIYIKNNSKKLHS